MLYFLAGWSGVSSWPGGYPLGLGLPSDTQPNDDYMQCIKSIYGDSGRILGNGKLRHSRRCKWVGHMGRPHRHCSTGMGGACSSEAGLSVPLGQVENLWPELCLDAKGPIVDVPSLPNKVQMDLQDGVDVSYCLR